MNRVMGKRLPRYKKLKANIEAWKKKKEKFPKKKYRPPFKKQVLLALAIIAECAKQNVRLAISPDDATESCGVPALSPLRHLLWPDDRLKRGELKAIFIYCRDDDGKMLLLPVPGLQEILDNW